MAPRGCAHRSRADNGGAPRRPKADCDRTIVSLFVNPKQFAPGEDFAAYPREETEDLEKLEREGADLGFLPPVEEIYPLGFATRVRVEGLSEPLCGASRPGHFDGVATLVAKLLIESLPDAAYFGEKDYQQLLIVRRLARDRQ
jgi:pantoate--beta-alanine ligase